MRPPFSRTASFAPTFLLCVAVLLASPLNAHAQDPDDIGPDEAGAEETLNTQLWEYMKHTPYSQAKLYLAGLKRNPALASKAENVLPTGWVLSPAGSQVEVGRLPCEAVSYAGSIVVLNNGYYSMGQEDPEVSIVDPASGKVTRTLRLPSLFPSAAASPDGDLYISGGISKQVFRLNSQFERVKSYPIDGFVGGIAAMDETHIVVSMLVTASTQADFTKGNYNAGRIVVLNTVTGAIEASSNSGNFPYAVAYHNARVYATLLGDDKVEVLEAARLTPMRIITVGRKPQNMTIDGEKLYVVNTGSDSISVINTLTNAVVETYGLQSAKTDFGSAPVSCCIDRMNDRLYVALANSNAVAVLNLTTGHRIGAIPTGWYPTKVLQNKDKLVVLNGKGIRDRRPNPNGPQPAAGKGGPQYVLTLLKGSVGIIPMSEVSAHLSEWTRTADNSTPRSGMAKASRQPIKHIFYIVRENRTYDQVMGDLPAANGDPKLTLFGRDITPNGHKIAETFVTLDNYFADGEISVLGHSFTTSGYASPFLEWLGNAAYSGRFSGYPFGMVPAATSPAYLWDALDKKGLDYRIYGENYFLYTRAWDIIKDSMGPNSEPARKFYTQMLKAASVVDRGDKFYNLAMPYYGKADTPAAAETLLSDPVFLSDFSHFLCGDDTLAVVIPLRDELKKPFAACLAHYPFNYRSWDLKYSDLDRAKLWKADFEKQVKAGNVASLHYIWLPNDHTGGVSKNYLPPDQLVAQNDAALGYILETISNSPVWKDSLVLVTEDDAQNGPDHVDATRTVALAAGPYVKRGAVISDRFDQLSLIRTIDLLLGLSPMSQNDALAVPMYSIFAPKANITPFESIIPTHLSEADSARLKEMNTPGSDKKQ